MRNFLRRLRSEPVFLALVVGQMATAVGAFILNIIIARSLGPGPRGEIALMLQIVYASVALASLGRPQAVLIKLGSNRSPLSAALRLIRLPFLAGVAVALIVAAQLHSSVDRVLIFGVLSTQIIGGLIVVFLRAISILTSRPFAFLVTVAGSQITLLSGGIIILLTESGTVSSWLCLYAIGSFVPAVVATLVGLRTYPKVFQPDPEELRASSRFGLRVYPGYVFEHISGRLDRILIPLLATYSQLGLYAVVVSSLEIMLWPVKQLADSRVGRWSQLHSEGRFNVRACLVRLGSACLLGGIIAAIVLALLLVPVFGNSYAPALSLIPVAALATIMRAQAMTLTVVGLAAKRPRIGNTLNLVATATSLVAYLVLIPKLGAFGGALGSCLGFAAGFGVVAIIWNRRNLDE